jgi:tetratricopeptide (TPR) repeat protein
LADKYLQGVRSLSLTRDLQEYLGNQFILILEPAHNYRTSIKNFLTNLKIKHIRFVGSVAEAKREMLTVKVAMFIVEWQLPEKNGIQFCRELRKDKHFKSTPFLLLSTENLRKDVMLASEGGINSYLLKPFSYEDFCTQLSNLLNSVKNPSPLNSLIERAESHLEQKEFWVAEALLNEALSIKPNSAKAICGLGRIELGNGHIPLALKHFQNAISLNPDYVDGYKYILEIAELRQDQAGILQTATILNSMSPENPRYPLLIASAHMEMGNLADSEHFFKMSVKLSPMLADGHRGLGNVYLHQKEYEKARKALEKALDLDKKDVSTLNSLGLAYVRQNMVDDGIRKYRIALSLDPTDSRVLFNIGLAFEIKGDLQDAKEAFQRAIAANPAFDKAKRNLDRISKLLLGAAPQEKTQSGDEEVFSKLAIKKSA